MVGIVLVSHSRRLAEGVLELVRQMAPDQVRVAVAAGVDDPDHPIGTDATAVMAAIEQVDSADGVLVLMDLGSAVLSAETARDLLPPEVATRVLLCEAPLVEGAVAAAVQAGTGASLEEVAAEARRGLIEKVQHLGAAPAPEPAPPPEEAAAEALTSRLEVTNPLGLHARPAARFVSTVSRYPARVTVVNLTTGAGPVSGRSLTSLAALGVRQGHELEVRAAGEGTAEVLTELAELAAAGFGDTAPPPPPSPPPSPPPRSTRAGLLAGLPASPGVAVGPVRKLQPAAVQVPGGEVEDREAAWQQLSEALAATRRRLEETRREVAARASGEEAEIFTAHLLLLDDEDLTSRARRLILEQGRHPAAAWMEAAGEAAARLREVDDPYLAQRAVDIEAVARQVAAAVLGEEAAPQLTAPGVVVAADLTPAETATLRPEVAWGVATAAGGATSHAAILARALGIPAVVGLGEGLLQIEEGTRVVVDGDAGTLQVDPPPAVVAETERRRSESRRRREQAEQEAALPALTRDGARVEVAANLGSPEEAARAVAAGADGVGLLRTEFLFLHRQQAPDEEEQEAVYRSIAAALEGRPLTLRTLDVGGDKPLPYLPLPAEANPFLGVRGIRVGLAQPDLLLTQLRAALRVAADHPLRIMFPMVATVAELLEARRLLEEAATTVSVDPGTVEVGVMVEVPAAALSAAHLARHADFLSIGTNDLTQYTLAAERGNPQVAALADPLHPAVLSLIAATAEAGKRHGRWVGVCGELAGDPQVAGLLLGLGVGELSVVVPAVGLVKQAVRAVDGEAARRLAQQALAAPSAAAVRQLLDA